MRQIAAGFGWRLQHLKADEYLTVKGRMTAPGTKRPGTERHYKDCFVGYLVLS